jgi:hypothetical protein
MQFSYTGHWRGQAMRAISHGNAHGEAAPEVVTIRRTQ